MIHYQDRTFCARSAAGDCVNQECSRAISQKDLQEAERMELPLSVTDFKTEDCGYRPSELKERNG